MRLIPKRTKVVTELFKGVGVIDVCVGMFGALVSIALFTSTIPYKDWLATSSVLLFIILLVHIDDDKVYLLLMDGIRYFARPRSFGETEKKKNKKKKKNKFTVADITSFTGVEGNYINYNNEYYGVVIEIPSIEFKYFSEMRQNGLIERNMGSIIRSVLADQTAALVKLDRPIVYDKYVKSETKKLQELKQAYLNGLLENDEITKRVGIINDRILYINQINHKEKVYRSFHYLVFFHQKKGLLDDQARHAVSELRSGGLEAVQLGQQQLAIFLKYQYTQLFDEREVYQLEPQQYMEWILPKKVELTARTIRYDDLVTHTFKITDYPTFVTNAWGYRLFNTPNTRVVMKFRPIERGKAVRNIDRSIDELRGQGDETGKTSRIMELSEHVETLSDLLAMLQNESETLFDMNTYVTVYDYELTERNERIKRGETVPPTSQMVSLKKKVKASLTENNLRSSDLYMRTFEAYTSAQVSALDCFAKDSRGIPSSTLAATFPFVYPSMQDDDGISVGETSGIPSFINFFTRDTERVNSNMVIIGKSGSGKSYATKTLLANLAADNSKIFILDPENEYEALSRNLAGKIIDVGSATQGNLNPFHIITSFADDENDGEGNNSFNTHLQFLEEFFRQILTDIDSNAMEQLNNILVRMYEEKGINEYSDLSTLTADDFPLFDDLYDCLLQDFQAATGDYSKNNLRILINYISKFATGGRNSFLWNRPASIDTQQNFIVFNFQSLLANKNNIIANAQMLLVLKWLDNEIIKNRDYNLQNRANRKIIIVIDEAHVFIDSKYPVALDFMYQMAKRIRKYNGMQIIITQNIKDFMGTQELARKSTAIINACQYSFIFPLAPNDMHDLCALYEKAGAINENEQEQIINNPRGRAFVITSPSNRTTADIIAPDGIEQLFTQ